MNNGLPIWDVPLIATVKAGTYEEALAKVLAIRDPEASLVVWDKIEHDENGHRIVRLHNEGVPASRESRPR